MFNFEKPILRIVILVLVISITDISNLDAVIYKQFCLTIGLIFNNVCPDFYDLPIWIVGGTFGTILAAYFAFMAIRQSNKRLKIEQTPYVVLDHIIREENRYGFATKNIGRGPAVHITFSKSDEIDKRNDAFFSDDQQHSANFYPFEESYWYVDGNVMDNLRHENNFACLYIFYNNQTDEIFYDKS